MIFIVKTGATPRTSLTHPCAVAQQPASLRASSTSATTDRGAGQDSGRGHPSRTGVLLLIVRFSLIADQFQALGSAIGLVCSVVSDATATATVQVNVNILKIV